MKDRVDKSMGIVKPMGESSTKIKPTESFRFTKCVARRNRSWSDSSVKILASRCVSWISLWLVEKRPPRVPNKDTIPLSLSLLLIRCEFIMKGWVWDLDPIGAPSKLRLIRKTTDLTRIFETRDLSIEEKVVRRKWKKPRSNWIEETELLKLQKSGQFPDESVRIKVGKIRYVTSQTY
jgi:hypothetical protein